MKDWIREGNLSDNRKVGVSSTIIRISWNGDSVSFKANDKRLPRYCQSKSDWGCMIKDVLILYNAQFYMNETYSVNNKIYWDKTRCPRIRAACCEKIEWKIQTWMERYELRMAIIYQETQNHISVQNIFYYVACQRGWSKERIDHQDITETQL